jgi:hypothetical protein
VQEALKGQLNLEPYNQYYVLSLFMIQRRKTSGIGKMDCCKK